MSTIPAFGERQIEERAGARSFALGQEYAAQGAIYEARRQGHSLKARCEGSHGGPYRVEATFDETSLTAAECSCPVGAGGRCKHLAALLLTWLARPEEFVEVEETDRALERRSKEELIALIKQMLRQQPDLELLLETPLPGAGERQAPANAAIYRRQAEAAFRESTGEWGAEIGIAYRLRAILAIGEGFAEQGDCASAMAVYEGTASAVMANLESYGDDGGELGDVILTCIEDLGGCLQGTDDPPTRQATLQALFAIYRFDVSSGGFGLADAVPSLILNEATPEERRRVAGWVREALPATSGWSGDYQRQAYGGFLLALEAETLDDEAYLRLCRETGRHSDLVARLLDLGRIEEAAEEARHAADYPLLGLADLFVARGHPDLAERLLLERLGASNDLRLGEWLLRHYTAHGKPVPALEMAERVFHQQPSVPGYETVRRLAMETGRWHSLRPEVLAFLRQEKRGEILVRAHLDEGEIDQALKLVNAQGWTDATLRRAVAEAAEETRPRAALEIYRQAAERLINQQGRENYRQAAALLRRARGLSRGLGEDQAWAGYMAQLRERNQRLRALKEELEAAGL